MPLKQIYTHGVGKLNVVLKYDVGSDELSLVSSKAAEQKMIPWDVIIEILNKLQASNPGVTMERVNKYVNDEIYEWFNEQERSI